MRLKSGTSDNAPLQTFLESLGLTAESPPSLLVAILQPDNEPYAALYDDAETPLGTVNKTNWYAASQTALPEVEFIEPDVRFGSHIHISQLLAAYDEGGKTAIPTFFDTMPLNKVGRDVLGLEVPPAPKEGEEGEYPLELCSGVSTAQAELRKNVIRPKDNARLERDLFCHILEVPKPKLEVVQSLGQKSRGYVELLVSDINQRINQRLDIAHYWSQDEDISLSVNYKDGYFYFEIQDKTGKAFTFDERSSGLQYFLSYYVQALAIQKRNPQRGCIAIMDEPDRFLSAVAQRNLLEVFEMLTVPRGGRRLQLIYTTHSPFSINKNFPSRLRLVRKGDGSEGTQLVPKSASRNYEPVRSALGIEAGDTLFYGVNNIIVEGFSDQKAIIAGAQLCAADKSKSLLNLNTVTFLTANGVGKLQRIVERADDGIVEVERLVDRASTDDERRPVTVALIDGDKNGKRKIEDIKQRNLLPPKTYSTYSDLGIQLKTPGDGKERTAEVLEDLIPVSLLCEATSQYLQRAWGKRPEDETKVRDLLQVREERNLAEGVVATVRELEPNAENVSKVHIKGEITDIVFDELLWSKHFADERNLFTERVELIVSKINAQLHAADRDHRQSNIRKHARGLIDPYIKLHSDEATRFEVSNLLRDVSLIVTGTSEDARKTREQVAQLEELLDATTSLNTDPVDAVVWKARFQELWRCPWAEPKKGWAKVGIKDPA